MALCCSCAMLWLLVDTRESPGLSQAAAILLGLINAVLGVVVLLGMVVFNYKVGERKRMNLPKMYRMSPKSFKL
jgi:hypothetical protein